MAKWFWAIPLAVMVVHRTVVWAAGRQGKRGVSTDAAEGPDLTWFRPLKAGVPELATKLTVFAGALRANDQVIFGVDPGSAEEQTCRAMAAQDGRIVVVACEGGVAANPKIGKLLQMRAFARNEHWVVADAEVRIERDFVVAFRKELAATDVVTVGYRLVGMRDWIGWLDALAIIQTLWPGLELVRRFGSVRFTLGACTGFRQADLQAIGGWEVLADQLAEDHQFGARLTAAGRTVRLSDAVLDLEADSLSWRYYWRHQRRVAITYRAATPAGAAGMILTRGFPICLLLAVAFPGQFTLVNALVATLVHLASVAEQGKRLGYRLGGWVFLSLLAETVETACWGLSWCSNRVWWAGKWRRITWRGHL